MGTPITAAAMGDPSMPPGLRAFALAGSEDVFARARQLAGSHGAGSLFWSRRPDLVDLAVVLEPDEPLPQALRAVYLGMLALADTLAAHAPPERPIRIRWPSGVLVDGAIAGGGRLAWPEPQEPGLPPVHLVFGVTLRLDWPQDFEPGQLPGHTALAEEGFETDPPTLVESFARHLLFRADALARGGFEGLAGAYAKWLDPPGRLDAQGDLVSGKYPLAARLLAPEWLENWPPDGQVSA